MQRAVYTVLDGEGARRFGGRWHRPGSGVIYTSENVALYVLELLVYLDTELVPDNFTSYELDVLDECTRGASAERRLHQGRFRPADDERGRA